MWVWVTTNYLHKQTLDIGIIEDIFNKQTLTFGHANNLGFGVYDKRLQCKIGMTQFQIEGGGLVQGVTNLFTTFSAFVT